MDEFQLLAIDAGAEDIQDEEDPVRIITAPEEASNVKNALEENGYTASYELTYIPKNTVSVSGNDAEKLLKLLNVLEDNDDVQEVYANFEMDDSEMEALMEKMQ